MLMDGGVVPGGGLTVATPPARLRCHGERATITVDGHRVRCENHNFGPTKKPGRIIGDPRDRDPNTGLPCLAARALALPLR